VKRTLLLILCALVALPTAYAAKPKPKKKPPPPKPPTCPKDATLGRVAYVRDGQLHVIELGTCKDRVLVSSGAAGPVKFSPDGKSIAFSAGVVPAAGGRVKPGSTLWRPSGSTSARITSKGGLLIGAHRIVKDGWGAVSAAWTPQGNLVVTRSVGARSQLWFWFQDTGHLLNVAPLKNTRSAQLVGVSADGRWAFWFSKSNSSSDADGVPLDSMLLSARKVGAPITRTMLAYPDYVTWCGGRLVVVSGGSKVATADKSLVIAAPQSYRPKPLIADSTRSWASPSCSSDGQIVVLSQPTNRSATPAWSIWKVDLKGKATKVLSPGPKQTFASPRWAPDGSIFFVRVPANGHGQLMLWRGGQVVGPITDLGAETPYYGHHDWWDAADWHS
jgi:Tol biopolymer transport system component